MLTYNDVLDELQDYILDEDNIKKSLRIKVSSEKINKPVFIKSNIEKKSDLFVPKQQDTLFWCYYIMKRVRRVHTCYYKSRQFTHENVLEIYHCRNCRKIRN